MVTIFRSIKWATRGFFRHFGLSFITTVIIVLSLFSLTLLLFLNIIAKILVKNLEDRIDVTLYLKENVNQQEIENFKNYLAGQPEVKEIIYFSPEESLKRFKEKHKEDESILKSLEVIEKNPFGGVLILKASSIKDYPVLLEKIDDPAYEKIIEEKDFYEYQKIISKVKNISQKIYFAGLLIVLIFSLISIIAIFNSIRLTVYARKEEIKIMRLIGATSSFTRTPFVIENIFYGLCAWFINLLIFLLIFKFALEKIIDFLEIEKELFFSYQKEMIYSFLGVLIFSIFLTLSSSWLAVRKYIKT